jgi:vacuolar-type H+-ATPase subunit F/Vma7
VNALLKYVTKKKKEALFMDAQTRFLLDITAFKTPTGKHQYYNIVLPNSPFASPLDTLDILLVVRDMKGVEPEHVIGQVKDELRDSDNTRNKLKVRQIMTLKQLQDDYSTYEAKRALSKSVDVVIVERNIFKMMPTLLGREFQKKKKFQLQIPGREFKDKDLGEQIIYALTKTVLHVSMKGQTSTIVVHLIN